MTFNRMGFGLALNVGGNLSLSKLGKVLKRAAAWYHASSMESSDDQTVINEIDAELARAVRGSNFAAYIDGRGLTVSGVANHGFQTEANPFPHDFVDADLRVIFEPGVSWVGGTPIITRIGGGVQLRVNGSGTVQWYLDNTMVASQGFGANADTTTGIRIVHDADNGAGGTDVSFYQTPDYGQTWTQVGTTQTIATTPIPASTGQFSSPGGSACPPMTVRSIELWDGATRYASPDFTAQVIGTTEFDDAEGNTWASNVSNTGIDAADPLFLPHDGEHYVYAYNDATNFGNAVWADAPIAIAADSVTTWTWRGIVPDDAASHYVMGAGANSSASSYFGVLTTDQINFRLYKNGLGGVASAVSSVALPSIPATPMWLRAVVDVTTANVVIEYSFEDVPDKADVTWIQLGTAVTGTNAGTEPNQQAGTSVNDALKVGSLAADSFNNGSVDSYFADVVIDGSVVASFNPNRDIDTTFDADAGQSTWESATGETWTVNRSADGYKTAVVTQPVWLFDGVDDYIDLPASDEPTFTATSGKHSVVSVFRSFGTTGSQQGLWSTFGADLDGVDFALKGPAWGGSKGQVVVRFLGTGTDIGGWSAPKQASLIDGKVHVVVLTMNDGEATLFVDGDLKGTVDYSGVGAMTHTAPRLGNFLPAAATAGAGDFEMFAHYEFPDALVTEAEVDTLIAELSPSSTTALVFKASSMTGANDQTVVNALGGAAAKRGTTKAVDANDPAFIDHDGDHYVHFPEVPLAGNTVSSTITAVPTNEFDYRMDLAMREVPSTASYFFWSFGSNSLRNSGTSSKPWTFFYDESDTLRGNYGPVGTANSYEGLGIEAYERVHLRTHMKLSSTDGLISWFWRPHGIDELDGDTGWIAAGTIGATGFGDIRKRGETSAFTLNSTNYYGNDFYRVLLLDIENDRVECDFYPDRDIDTTFDPDDGQTSWVSATGETWTVNRSATGYQTSVVTKPVWQFDGIDDLIELPKALFRLRPKDKLTMVAVYRRGAVGAGNDRLISYANSTDGTAGPYISFNTSVSVGQRDLTPAWSGGSSLATAPDLHRTHVVAGVWDGEGNVTVWVDSVGLGASNTIPVDATPTGPGRIGNEATATSSPWSGEIFEVQIVPGVAHTESQLEALVFELTGRRAPT